MTLKMRAALVALIGTCLAGSAFLAAQQRGAPTATAIAAPAGADGLDVRWVKFSTPDVGDFAAAVSLPAGAGPFPVVVVMHGTHGLGREYVEIARTLARAGMIGVAPCWFAGGSGAGVGVIHPIACAGAPPLVDANAPEAAARIDALLAAVRTLPSARADRIALFGHSRGAGAALNYVLRNPGVRAVVLDSSGYEPAVTARADDLKASVLILHGVADGPANAGSEMTNVKMARGFEAAAKKAGKAIEAKYYERGEHNSIFTTPAQRDDMLKTMTAFLRRELK